MPYIRNNVWLVGVPVTLNPRMALRREAFLTENMYF